MFDSFTACQVHDVEFRLLDLDEFVLLDLRLDEQGENDMRTRTLSIHGGIGHFTGFIALK